MLRVTVELCPGGSDLGREIVAEGIIYQDKDSMTLDQMDLTTKRNYIGCFTSEDLQGNRVGGTCQIVEFDRQKSSLKLLKNCLNQMDFED